MTKRPEILIVSQGKMMQQRLSDVLISQKHFAVHRASDFDSALDVLMTNPINLVIAHNELQGLNAIDLLVIVQRAFPRVGFIVLDRDIVSKTAVAALRLGALDYLAEPLNIDLLLMQIERFFKRDELNKAREMAQVRVADYPTSNRLDMARRAVTFTLKRQQYEAINCLLQELATHTNARFVGLLDADDNVTAAVGQLEQMDLKLLKRALSADYSIASELADVLSIDRFQANFYEGKQNCVYSIQLSGEREAKLVTICPVNEKAGNTWLQTKRIARQIEQVLNSVSIKPNTLIAFGNL